MLGLFGTLNMGARALQTQQQGVEVAGHNLANVNNPNYARQRLHLGASPSIPDSALGPQGTGVESVAINQVRSALVDRQLSSEISITRFLEAEQQALDYAQAGLGQQIDRKSSTAEGATAASGAGGQNGLAEDINELFAAFQSLSTNPTSTAERQVLLLKAQSMASQFNQVDERMAGLQSTLNESITADVERVNVLLSEIAKLNDRIVNIEITTPGLANDLRDARIANIEELAQHVNIRTGETASGSMTVSIGGNLVVDGDDVLDTIGTFDPGNGMLQIRMQGSGNALNLSGGSIAGTIAARDGGVQNLRDDINRLASQLITEVNSIHRNGFSLQGTTGEDFFTGTNAADITVNGVLLNDSSLVQAAAVNNAVGDNQIAVQLAKLANTRQASLGGQTMGQFYGESVAKLGQALNVVNSRLNDQGIVESMIRRQRDSISGVSLDEEMTELVRFQKAYQASARLINTVDEMLDTLLTLKR